MAKKRKITREHIEKLSKANTKRMKNKTYEEIYGQKSNQIKNKISKSHKGKLISKETRDKISKAFKGKTYEEIYGEDIARKKKENLKKSLRDRKYSDEKRKEINEKISQSKLGHTVSKETRDKISKAFKGKSYEEIMGKEKARQKKDKLKNIMVGNNNPFHGKKHNNDNLKKMSEAKKGKTYEEIYGEDIARKKKENFNKSMSGENHFNWMGGLSFIPYDKKFNRKFKKEIKERDNHICMKCLKHKKELDYPLAIHHVNYDKQLSIKENCITLCNRCNTEVNKNRIHWIKFFQSILKEKYKYEYDKNNEIILNYDIIK